MSKARNLTRREILVRTAGAVAGCGILEYGLSAIGYASTVPIDNPAARLKLPWTDKIPWKRVIDINDVPGDSWQARLATAQERLVAENGGVVYFPPGEYRFVDSLAIQNGIVLRGANPKYSDASSSPYSLSSRFEFPKYEPSFSGSGTSIDTAFKGKLHLQYRSNRDRLYW